MTIRIICKHCNSKIDAKDELRGQTRRCPKCRNPILIEPTVMTRPESTQQSSSTETTSETPLKVRQLRLDNIYVILGNDREIAFWKKAEGWFINVGNGFEAIKRAPEKLPDVGTFILAEGYVKQTDNGRKLKGLRFKQLSGRGVLKALIYSEVAILEKAKEPAVPSSAQKKLLLQHIRKHYFFEFTDETPEIIDYLTGFDSHSHEIGTFEAD